MACPDGCLSCHDCYRCKICRPEFIFDPSSQKCFELCGDGKRFNLECDDGNNIDGDGCSRDCKLESGYQCVGGCPDGRDNCLYYKPDRIEISQIGQIRRSTSVVVNIKINYLPESLIQAQECSNKCSQLLTGAIISGDNALSITSEYLPGTRYMFTMTIEFGRSYMAQFKLKISINNSVLKYFGGASISPLECSV